MHTVVGAGATSGGSMDASNLLKPALARGQLRCIGATTIDEYRKYIEKDKVNTSNTRSKRTDHCHSYLCLYVPRASRFFPQSSFLVGT